MNNSKDLRNLNSFDFIGDTDTTLNEYAKQWIADIKVDIEDWITAEFEDEQLDDIVVSLANEILRILD